MGGASVVHRIAMTPNLQELLGVEDIMFMITLKKKIKTLYLMVIAEYSSLCIYRPTKLSKINAIKKI